MWLKDSSIGRKFIMSITGLFLVLFLLFHGSMNICLVVDDLFGTAGYNWICEMLGANWYAIAGTLVLALGVVVHFCFAIYLTIQNLAARGKDRYAIEARQEGVDWASKNMLVLGIIVILGLCLHLYNMWFKMQFAELFGVQTSMFDPQNGSAIVTALFTSGWSGIIYCLVYIIWLVGLWFHLSHGVWSALQTLGWSNLIWLKRIKVIGTVFATIAVGLFMIVVLYFLGVNIGLMIA
ncbi:MAG: succinate dehydrogenase/fumarate reductase cytochrome b subunit [Paludibacteraceae bacterium]|nr:succinate dehydrogenase/fumarate reductase cytochrome b subunit [Candidatus Colicola coprequi]MCQ2334024.1 succinate dehydrogenase/fumarate reductase cytochrome b subunit [Paludibacteraceae bacterium]